MRLTCKMGTKLTFGTSANAYLYMYIYIYTYLHMLKDERNSIHILNQISIAILFGGEQLVRIIYCHKI